MKKVFYNKYTKLIVFAIWVALVTGIIYQSVTVAIYQRKFLDEKETAIESLYSNDEVDNRITSELLHQMNRCINEYLEHGMEGAELYTNSVNKAEKRFNVIIGSETEIMSTFYDAPKGVVINGYFYTQYLFETNDHYTFKVQFTSTGDILVSDGTERLFGIDYLKEEGAFDENVYAFLKDNAGKFAIIVTTRDKMVIDYYHENEEMLDKEIQMLQNDRNKAIENEIGQIVYFLCALLIISVISVIQCGKVPDGKKELHKWECGYTEIHILAIGMSIAAFLFIIELFIYKGTNLSGSYYRYAKNGYIIGVLMAAICVYYETGVLIKKIKNRRVCKDLLIIRAIARIKRFLAKKAKVIYDKNAYNALPAIKKLYLKKVAMDVTIELFDILLVILISTIANSTWMERTVGYVSTLLIVELVLFNTIYVIFSIKEYKHLREYNKICKCIDYIYSGRYGEVQEIDCGESIPLIQLSNLSDSFKESVAKQVEAEKMQIELVANVSHDLKTPLTSIISYVDLLSKEELPPVARDYVKVLEDKSARLKSIVADVFDLAKATSGEKIEIEQIDGVVLINQVLSDMSDRIEESGKDLRVKINADTAPVMGNGQKLYRVFQNIIDNALKYSMPGTRIYLSAEQIGGEFKVVVKNVSEFEIKCTVEEILSRFTRGDKSRHSEGTGLGLSIAKSFTELCGGTFEVKLEDDLFMVIIYLR